MSATPEHNVAKRVIGGVMDHYLTGLEAPEHQAYRTPKHGVEKKIAGRAMDRYLADMNKEQASQYLAELNQEQLDQHLGQSDPTRIAANSLPEVSPPSASDPSAELKQMLNVHGPAAVPGVEQPNPLLNMLHGTHGPQPPPQQAAGYACSPQNPPPFHARMPSLSEMGGPQTWSSGLPYPRPQQPPHPYMSQGYPEHLGQALPPPLRAPVFRQPSGPAGYHARPYQRPDDAYFVQQPQAPVIPPASKLPAPKLNAHTLNLLNAFKSTQEPAPQTFASRPPTDDFPQYPTVPQAPVGRHASEAFSQRSQINLTSPTPVNVRRPSGAPVAPKPRSAHQSALLDLFRAPSASAATLSASGPSHLAPGLIELSAQPTPGTAMGGSMAPETMDIHARGQDARAAGLNLTSATVTGPVNAPDFHTLETSTGNDQFKAYRSSDVSSNNSAYVQGPQPSVLAQPISRTSFRSSLEQAASQPVITSAPASASTPQPTLVQSHVFSQHERLQPPVATSYATRPAVRGTTADSKARDRLSFDSRGSIANEQKETLLSLFAKPPHAHASQATAKAPAMAAANPALSSPVSPALSDAAAAPPRSRLSSVGESIAPPQAARAAPEAADAPLSGGASGPTPTGPRRPDKSPATPVEQILLGVLGNVARGKR